RLRHAGLRRALRRPEIAARAHTRVSKALLEELPASLEARHGPVRLHDGRPDPVEAEPLEIPQDRVGGARNDARRIDVLDAKDDVAAPRAGVPPRDHEGARMTEVQLASGAREEPPDGALASVRHADGSLTPWRAAASAR